MEKMTERIVKPVIHLSSESIGIGQQLDLIIENVVLTSQSQCMINIICIGDDYSHSVLGYGTPICCNGPCIKIIGIPTNKLGAGLYQLSNISFSGGNPEIEDMTQFTPDDFGICLFEIREEKAVPATWQQLHDLYASIIQSRNNSFLSGFGESASYHNEYMGLVFVKDCLMTRRLRLGQYELIPFDGLTCNDELGLIQNFLEKAGLPLLSNTEESLNRAQHGQPTVVIWFPRVFADSVNHAGTMIETEVRILGELLSLFRNSYADIFGSVIIDSSSQLPYFKIDTPSYKGNLLGGEISGEDARHIKSRMDRIRNDLKLQLYIALYKEALKESNVEIAYFRYWNLLEIIARSKNLIGAPKLNWNGTFVLNKKHQPLMISSSEELVTELIRRSGMTEQMLACGLKQGLITEQIPIWYRHRNCMVHTGGCFPDDINYCKRSNRKFEACRQAHEEIVATGVERDCFFDGYLRALREASLIMIIRECDRV